MEVPSEMTVSCGRCWKDTEPVYRGDWMCKKHALEQRMCEDSTEGCTYSDIEMKCEKHEWFYCQYSTLCLICSEDIIGTTLDSHYTQAHGDITHRAGTVFTVSPSFEDEELIIDCDFGRAVCRYMLTKYSFQFRLYTPVPSAQLYKYRCTVELSHPDTGHTLTRTPAVMYNRREDWAVRIPRSDYNACAHDNKINIKINITKIDKLSQFMF